MSLRIASIVVGLASVALAACASSGAIRAAHEARYTGPRHAMLAVVAEAVGERPDLRVQRVELDRGLVVTTSFGEWLEGTEERFSSGFVGRSQVLMCFEVALVGTADGYRVEVTPIMALIRVGYSAPIPLAPEDPQVPGWVSGRTEKLTLAIYDALAAYRVDAVQTASAAR
jgi:hypothetical protein